MQHTINRKWALTFGVMLALPTAYFIFISLLKFGLGISGPFDAIEPSMNSWGSNEPLGWNINLLILFGPLIAIVLNLIAVLRIEWYNERENISIKFSIQKHWRNMVLVIFSGLLLATLFIYAIGENCRC